MKLQKNYHTTYNVIKGTTFLMLFFLYTLSCYSNDNLPQLEVKQRKGNMLITQYGITLIHVYRESSET